MKKRLLALIVCLLFVLLLGAGFVHAAQHLRHDHADHLATHGGCAVCAVLHKVFDIFDRGLFLLAGLLSLLRALRGAGAVLAAFVRCLSRPTPVSLRVKMTN